MHDRFLTVEVDLIFRLIIATADVHLTHSGNCQQLTLQVGRHAVGHCHIISIHLKIGTGLSRHPRVATSKYNLCLAEFRIGFQIFTHLVTDSFQCDITITRIYQTDIE